MKLRTLGIIIALAIPLVALFSTLPASAATFTPNLLMDNAVFDNASSMNATQIDNFLNQFPNSCISTNNGFTSPDVVGYSTANNTFNYGANVSAGRVIDHAAEAYGINPQVLLATLQKEQSLVTGSAGCYPNVPSPSWPSSSSPAPNSTFTCTINGNSTTCTYACPYNGGCVSIAVGYDCPYYCKATSEGFSKQIIRAAWSLRFHEQRSMGNVGWDVQKTTTVDSSGNSWASSWDNSNDPPTYYYGFMTTGTYARYQGGPTASYDGYGTITDLSNNPASVHMDTGATAALYDYTPFESGNQSFVNIFTNWFGSTQLSISCDSKVAGVTCVWSAIEPDGSQFLTASKPELDNAIKTYGYTYSGIGLYAPQTQLSGTVPVHRLNQGSTHFYTASQSEYDTMIASGNWVDEGIVFYVYPSTVSSSASHPVYRLFNSSKNQHYWTTDESQKTFLLSSGYVLESNVFNGFSGLLNLPVPSTGRDNIYRLGENVGYFYTTSLPELESVIKSGYPYEGVLTTASASNTGTAIYRLQNGGRHFYTASSSEKDTAVSKYGYTYEGVAFYVDDSSAQIYRLANTSNGSYLYTSSIDEVMSLTNTRGWTYDGPLIDKNGSPSPVYRFLNLLSNKHFYTIDINEATRITNKGWQYETVAFYANKSTGLPVYRLLKYDKHFYTTDTNEMNIAISKYGYVYEGVAFYVSQTTTAMPVYRLQGGGNEYLYTASSSEKDTAISKYGYLYEGTGFYLPVN